MPRSKRYEASVDEALRRAADRPRVEGRALEQHVARRGADLAVAAAHHARDGDRPRGVADQDVLGRKLPFLLVERADRLAGMGAPHDDRGLREARAIESVQRLPVLHEHVVRHVDEVRNRPQTDGPQARLHPPRARSDRQARDDAPRVPRAADRVVDAEPRTFRHRHVVGVGPEVHGRATEGQPEERRDLAGDAEMPKTVGAVRRDRDLEHFVGEEVGDARARHLLVLKHDDARVIIREAQLVLGAQHTRRGHAADGARLDDAAGQLRPRPRPGDLPARRGHVGRAAHDFHGLPTVGDGDDGEPVSLRVLLDAEHLGDDHGVEVRTDRGRALHLEASHGEARRHLGGGRGHRHVVTKPAQRCFHVRP
jgi:hypothetical protein